MRWVKHNLRTVYLIASLAVLQTQETLYATTDSPEVVLDELSSVWSAYRYQFLKNGRVIEHDEGGITTSEAQSYAMLRSVWLGDEFTFDAAWNWTKQNLQVRQDHLFAWKYKNKVLDTNAATDADTDIALALFLAADRFHQDAYRIEAIKIAQDIYQKEFLITPTYVLPTAGNWTKNQQLVKIHTGYLAPNAYEVFAVHMPELRWRDAVDSSYKLLHWMLDDQKLKLPPEFVFFDRKKKSIVLKDPDTSTVRTFSYDVFPLLWRLAVDHVWFQRRESALREELLAPFRETWRSKGKIFERYNVRDGLPMSETVAPTLAATVRSLAGETKQVEFATELQAKLVKGYWSDLVRHSDSQPYYAQNWLWFAAALDAGLVRHFRESPSILQEFRSKKFMEALPWMELTLAAGLFLFSRKYLVARRAFLLVAFFGLIRYVVWRATYTLNVSEFMGPFISGSLWLAELYGLVTHLLLWVQVGTPGTKRKHLEVPLDSVDPAFSVDILIPIYSESLEILHKTIAAALEQRYQNFKIYVCDDSHRDSVKLLCEELGVGYVKGPKRHAKSGNLNNAMKFCAGELVVIFDTDHIPVESFLSETVPLFSDNKLGFVQTPHYFFNQDIFQRSAFAKRSLANELDLFNFGIMPRRDQWGGAFFIGSGAVFRRAALDGIGGFQLLSITEDIHTSQVLHDAGWRSSFVNKRLVAGLAAESLAGHIAQRRRWMQGCLQIFFKDNPLFRSGLSLRLKLAYLGSLLYFFFPLSRVVFWFAPLCFLFFHWHPILSDMSLLMANLVPCILLRMLINRVLLPGHQDPIWPRIYETIVCFPLVISMFSLVLPKALQFKVTPKGITTDRAVFDFRSSYLLVFASLLSVAALVKGAFEFHKYGIERDAYVLNAAWALSVLAIHLRTLVVCWEKPQRRQEDRVRGRRPVEFRLPNGSSFDLVPDNISMTGLAVVMSKSRWQDFQQGSECEVHMAHGDVSVALCANVLGHAAIDADKELVRMVFSKSLDRNVKTSLAKFIFSPVDLWAKVEMISTRRRAWDALKSVLLPCQPLVIKRMITTLFFMFLAVKSTRSFAVDGKYDWYLERGAENMQIKNYSAAAESYEKALALSPSSPKVLQALTEIYRKQGLNDKAVSTLDRRLQIDPDDIDAAVQLGEYLSWDRYRYRQADLISVYTRLIEHHDRDDIKLRLSDLLFATKNPKQYRRAMDLIEDLHKRHPTDLGISNNYRRALAKDRSRRSGALEEYRLQIAARPLDQDLRYEFAQFLVANNVGKSLEATDQFEALNEQYRAKPEFQLSYARALSRSPQRYEESIAWYDRYLKSHPSADVLLERADILASHSKTHTQGLKSYDQLLAKSPKDPTVNLHYGDALMMERDTAEDAVKQYEHALKKDPNNYHAHKGLGQAYAWLGQSDQSIYHLKAAKTLSKGKIANDADTASGSSNEVDTTLAAMRKGRETRVGIDAISWHQHGGGRDLDYNAALADVKGDLGPFVSGHAAVGVENLLGPESQSKVSGLVVGDLEARFTQKWVALLELKYRGLSKDFPVEYQVGMRLKPEILQLEAGIQGRIVEDSYESMTGEKQNPKVASSGGAFAKGPYVDLVHTTDQIETNVHLWQGLIETKESGRFDATFRKIYWRSSYDVSSAKDIAIGPSIVALATWMDQDNALVSYDRPDHAYDVALQIMTKWEWNEHQRAMFHLGPDFSSRFDNIDGARNEVGIRGDCGLGLDLSRTIQMNLQWDVQQRPKSGFDSYALLKWNWIF